MEKAKILVVEDDRDNMDLIRFMMERQGYLIFEAYNGREGVEIARQEMPDLILMDLAMPEMDGWTAAKTLKADPATQHIKIVVLSVRSLMEDRRKAAEAGVDAFVTKPMSMQHLAEVVEKYLD